jgi:hypothetical protein
VLEFDYSLVEWSVVAECEECYELLHHYGHKYPRLSARETKIIHIDKRTQIPDRTEMITKMTIKYGKPIFPAVYTRLEYFKHSSKLLNELLDKMPCPNYRLEIPSLPPSSSSSSSSSSTSSSTSASCLGWDIHKEVLLAHCPFFFERLSSCTAFLSTLESPALSVPVFIHYLYKSITNFNIPQIAPALLFEVWRIASFFEILNLQSIMASNCETWLVQKKNIVRYCTEYVFVWLFHFIYLSEQI